MLQIDATKPKLIYHSQDGAPFHEQRQRPHTTCRARWRGQIPACSQVLSTASDVFAAVFSDCFAEGQNLSASDPKVITLPDDDAEAMRTVVDTLHFRDPDFRATPDLQELLNIARSVDKYQITSAVVYPSYTWLSIIDKGRFENCVSLVVASYLMRDTESFRRHTRRLVMGHRWHAGNLIEALNNHSCMTADFLLKVVWEYHGQDRSI